MRFDGTGVILNAWMIDEISLAVRNLFASRYLLHAIKGAAGLEPSDLLVVQCVVQLDLVH